MLPKKVGIAIPSCGFPCLIECLYSIARVSSKQFEIRVAVMDNPKHKAQSDDTWRQAAMFVNNENLKRAKPIRFDRIEGSEPIGFGHAVNVATRHLLSEEPDLDFLIVLNDDTVVSAGWITGMWFATKTKMINTLNRSALGDGPLPLTTLYREDGFKGLGLVGPCSDGSSGNQYVKTTEMLPKLGYEEYARQYRVENAGQFISTEFLSGFCVGITRPALDDLIADNPENNLFDERFKIGGFEDNDLCLRARNLGWELVIAKNTFILHSAHETLTKIAPEIEKGMANFLDLLLKYERSGEREKAVGVIRVAFKCVNDLAQYFSAIRRASLFLDGFAVLLTNDPLTITESYDRPLLESLPEPCKQYIKALIDLERDQPLPEEEYHNKAAELLKTATEAFLDPRRNHPIEVVSEYWHSDFNERDERNRTHDMALDMGAKWLVSIDADEVIEDRISPQLFRRWLSNPNPIKRCFNVGWINHWETMSLVRVDVPFTTGGHIRMTGPRIWRADRMRIVSGNNVGLHCGNAPYFTGYSSDQLAFRFRHLSHVRGVDRMAKTNFYNNLDQDKKTLLIGNSDYSHIVKSERVSVSIYNAANGIGVFCLMYEDENPIFYGTQLDRYYGSADRLVTVWTGEWAEKDKGWLTYTEPFPAREEWRERYPTGPCYEVAQYGRLYGVEWLHEPLTDEGGLAKCRNAAVDHLRNTNNGSLGWCYFFDPDELPARNCPIVGAYLRGLAEVNDTWGFMVNFANPTIESMRGEMPHPKSEAIRMFRLDQQGIMRFSGRVHETLDKSIKELQAGGIHPNIQNTKLAFVNIGLSREPEKMRAKLEKYQTLLVEHLKEEPLNSAAWLALGLQLLNDDDEERAQICIERSVLCAGSAYMPFRELANMHLRNALALMIQARQRVGDNFHWAEVGDQIIDFLSQVAPPMPKVNTGTQDVSVNISIPPFPYDKITLEGDTFTYASESNLEAVPRDDSGRQE